MTYQVYLIREDVALDELFDHARRENWDLLRRMPRRGNLGAFWEWSVGAEDRAFLVDSPFYGVRYVSWPEDRAMPDFWASAMTRSTVEDAAAKAKEASLPADKIRTLCEAYPHYSPEPPEALRNVLVERLRDEEEAVRWTAYSALDHLSDVGINAVLEGLLSGEVPAELDTPARTLHRVVQATMRGDFIKDLDTKDTDYLRQAMDNARNEKKWRRVEVAAARLLWLDKPFRELRAAVTWAAAMAATDRPWKAWIVALVVSELDKVAGREGMAAAIRAEVEPKLASREDNLSRDDLHPVLWLLRDRSLEDGWPDALDWVIEALEMHVKGYEAERLVMRIIADSSAKRIDEACVSTRKLVNLCPNAITPRALVVYLQAHGDDSDRLLADYEALAAAIENSEAVAKGTPEKREPEEVTLDVWAEGILAYHARKPHDLLRDQMVLLRKRGDFEGALRIADRATQVRGTALAWMDKAFIFTAMKRHHDAIAAYSEAITRVDKDGMVLLGGSYDVCWFNRACERAISGEVDGALYDLAEAIRQDEKWIESAKTDDYFDLIRNDPRFERLLQGDLDAAPVPEPPENWETLSSRCKGLSFQARYDEAIGAGRAAVRKAEKEFGADAPQVASCLESLGFALTWGGHSEEGVTVLQRAVAIREKENAESPEAAESYHHLGSALLHTGKPEEADTYYRRALALREKHDGVESLLASKSWGDMAGVSFQAGRSDEGVERIQRSRAILEKVIAAHEKQGHGPENDTLIEARADLITACSNLVLTHIRRGEEAQAVEAARGAVAQAVCPGVTVNDRLRTSLAQCLQHLVEKGTEGALEVLAALADAVLPKEPVEVRLARVRWAQIRQALQALRDAGHSDQAIIELMMDTLRGTPPPQKFTRIEGVAEALSSFVHELSTAQGGNFVVTLMALQTAAAGGQTFDEAFQNLQELAISSAAVAAEKKVGNEAAGEKNQNDGRTDDGPPPWERDPFGNPYIDRELNRRIGLSDDGEFEDDDDYDDDEEASDEGDEEGTYEDEDEDEGDED